MNTLTKEWLMKTIAELEEERDATPGAVNEDAAMALAAMKLALASLEAEPVCVIDQSNLDYLNSGSDADVWPASRAEMGDVLLYRAAPPVPVSVKIPPEKPHTDGPLADGWNACSAAMLQGADGKPELTVWYGAMPETNGKTKWTAMLHRKGHHPWEGITIDRSKYPGRVRYEADRMRHLIGELADEPDILAYDSDAHSGYVEPVTTAYKLPDGWVACSERMPEGMTDVHISNGHDVGQGWWDGDTWQTQHDYYSVPGDVTHWMPLPAAPQQEAKNV